MNLLHFARGPLLALAALVFASGVAWRLWGLWRRPPMPELSAARAGAPAPWQGALHHVWRGLHPGRAMGSGHFLRGLNAYVMHIGLGLIFFGYGPHIEFIRRHTGVGWPALPDAVMYLAAGVTILSMLGALLARLNDPVRRLIGNADDWLSWALTFLPLITGMAVVSEASVNTIARDHVVFPGPLAVHLIAFELLLLWFPFGKLMHAFFFPFSRGATGMRLGHRGVRT